MGKRHRRASLLLIALSTFAIGVSGCAAAPSSAGSPTGSTGQTTAPAASGWQLVRAHGAVGIRAAGLTALPAEGTVEHFHAHLDVIADGAAIPVPAEIGVSFGAGGEPEGISALHTHDESGIIHIEAPMAGVTYTLGQLLTEWGVLDGTSTTPGSAHSSVADWKVYVNGSQQTGSPKDVLLKPHDEIVLVHGAVPATIPSSYSFPSGL